MPFVSLAESPNAPGLSPIHIYYREHGRGAPLIFLHGGWGYDIYPFDRQIEAFSGNFRILIPDRSGYGRSPRVKEFTSDFHKKAAEETLCFINALALDRPVLWGHSDGAVIAAIMGLKHPHRFRGLIMEAFHYNRAKPQSRAFFESMVAEPALLGDRVCTTLAREHGDDYWKKLLEMNGRAWLTIGDESDQPERDFYHGRLSELRVPSLLIHGSNDKRTEPGELESIRRLLPQVEMRVIDGAGHSPHSARGAYSECNRLAGEFLDRLLDPDQESASS